MNIISQQWSASRLREFETDYLRSWEVAKLGFGSQRSIFADMAVLLTHGRKEESSHQCFSNVCISLLSPSSTFRCHLSDLLTRISFIGVYLVAWQCWSPLFIHNLQRNNQSIQFNWRSVIFGLTSRNRNTNQCEIFQRHYSLSRFSPFPWAMKKLTLHQKSNYDPKEYIPIWTNWGTHNLWCKDSRLHNRLSNAVTLTNSLRLINLFFRTICPSEV